MNCYIKKVSFAICICAMLSQAAPVFSQSISTENDPNLAPTSVWKEIRRSEIITLGSLPFVTLFTTLGFSIGSYIYHGYDPAYSPNPFAQSSKGLSEKEQVAVLLTSLGISLGIGLTDLTIRLVKRNNARKRAEQNKQKAIQVEPVALDSRATKLPPPKRKTHSYEYPPAVTLK